MSLEDQVENAGRALDREGRRTLGRQGSDRPLLRGDGLVPAPPRTRTNRRTYSEGDLRRLKFVRHARELGLDIEAIRQLLALAGLPDEPCEEADQIARARLSEVECKIVRLRALRRELQGMVDSGNHGVVRECRVIEVLAGPAA